MAGTPCWEGRKCGREKDCPAHPDYGFDCWTVEGTLCRGERQGSFEQKIGACRETCKDYEDLRTGQITIT